MKLWITSANGSRENGFAYWDFGAAGKAHYDVEKSFIELGARTIDLFVYFWNDESHDSLRRRFDGTLAGIKKDDIVFVQWPLSNSEKYIVDFLDYIKTIGAQTVAVIHDISLWRSNNAEQMVNKIQNHEFSADNEINLLSRFDGLIVHSENMKRRLISEMQLFKTYHDQKFTVLGPFGFSAVRNTLNWQRHFNAQIDYAGMLYKASFVKELANEVSFNLYGPTDKLPELNEQQKKHISFKGNFDHEALTHELQGSFGLVWSSESFPGVTGIMGDYEKYNSPHKLSMYLAADEPVIVYKGSAAAEFVSKNQIGIVINDLTEIKQELLSMTNEKYESIFMNTHRIGSLIRENFPIKRAALNMVSQLCWKK